MIGIAGMVSYVVLRGALLPVLVGVAIGAAGIVPLTGALQSFLFDVAPADPVSLAAGGAALLLAAITAAYIPARRATRVDPLVALRQTLTRA